MIGCMQAIHNTLFRLRTNPLPQKVLPGSVGKHRPSRYVRPLILALTLFQPKLTLLSRLPAPRRSYRIVIPSELLRSVDPCKKFNN